MQVVSRRVCLLRSQNSASATRMLVWPSAVPMLARTTHQGEGLCSPTSHDISEASGWPEMSLETSTERHVPSTVILTVAFQGGGVVV